MKRAEEERERREKEKSERKTQKAKIMLGDTGVMDNLLEALQSGELFGASAPTSHQNRVRRTARDPRRDAAADFRRTVKQTIQA